MSFQTVMLLLLLAASLVLFYARWLRSDLVALLVLLALAIPWQRDASGGLVGFLAPQEAFAGFGSSAVIMVVAMFVVSAGMVRTGAAELIGRRLLERTAHSEVLMQGAVLGAVTLFSSMVNDTTAVLVWMPVVAAVCQERGLSPGRYYLAVAYGALLGGQWTLIGTRSNILISDFLSAHTGRGFGFFELTPMAFSAFVGCVAFYLLVGRRFLPRARPETGLADAYEVSDFLTEVLVTPEAGTKLDPTRLKASYGVDVLEIVRGSHRFVPAPGMQLSAEDVLIVQGPSARIGQLLKAPEFKLREELRIAEGTLRSVDLVMVEALVTQNSNLVGRSLEDVDILRDYSFSVLAMARQGRTFREGLRQVPLRFGDTLLLCGHAEGLGRLRRTPDLILVESQPFPILPRWKAFLMLGVLAAMALAAAGKILSPSVGLPLAAVVTVLAGCLSARELYRTISWEAVVVVGGMMSMGYALEKTGAAEELAQLLSGILPTQQPALVLGLLLLCSVLTTQIIENAAVAIILAPIFYRIAQETGLEPRTVMMALSITISAGFMSPVGHEGIILVAGPGRYEVKHYLRIGGGFAFLTWALTLLVASLFYPL